MTDSETVSAAALSRPAEAAPRVVYGIDDRPPLQEAIPLGFQHLVAMLLGNITPPLLITGALGLATGEIAFVLQMVLVMAGLATLVQAYPIGPVGGRIPVIMGTSIAFVGGAIAIGREPTDRELRGGLVADGVMSGFAALFSAFPNTSYSQNVGLVNFTGVVSRHVTAIGGIILVALGVVPKVGALFATIPPAVIGGGGLIMFAMIFASGLSIIHRSVPLTRRNLVILAVATGLGLGVELRPDALQHLPEGLRTFFGSGLIAGGLTALALNLVFPERQRTEPGRETG